MKKLKDLIIFYLLKRKVKKILVSYYARRDFAFAQHNHSNMVEIERRRNRRLDLIMVLIGILLGILVFFIYRGVTSQKTYGVLPKKIAPVSRYEQKGIHIPKVQAEGLKTQAEMSQNNSEYEIVLMQPYGEVLWKIYGLETTWGKNDWCRLSGQGFGGFGVMFGGEVVCYESFEVAANRASFWFSKLNPDANLVNALCVWNLGGVNAPYSECDYYYKFLQIT